MRAHRHIIFADTSGLFNGDRLINVLNFTSPSKIQISGNRTDFKTEIQKHYPYKKSEKIHHVHVITCFNRLICPRVRPCSKKCHSTNKIIPRDTCVTLQTKIIRDNQKEERLCKQNYKDYRNLDQTFSETIFKKQINI